MSTAMNNQPGQPLPSLVAPETLDRIHARLRSHGWIRLTGYDSHLDAFSELVRTLCRRVTFDPARDNTSAETQKVDAGTGAIGLHIENGNTPLPPDIVSFYCERAAREGSQTTVCDGVKLLEAMPDRLRDLFSQKLRVRRKLPPLLWKRYVAKYLNILDPSLIGAPELAAFMAEVPGQTGVVAADETLDHTLVVQPLLTSSFHDRLAFANAVLGPSYNYEPPRYQFEDGSEITPEIIAELTGIAERFTEEIAWQHREVVVIDNRRVMHGRWSVAGDPEQRRLFIGMGNL